MNTGLPTHPPGSSLQAINSLLVYGANIFAATETGIWKRPLSEMVTSAPALLPKRPELFQLDQNYPNPFNPSTTIRFQISKTSNVILKVFDQLGRHISTTAMREYLPGIYEIRFDGTGLATGVYYYQLEAGDFVQTRKFLLEK